MQTTNFIKYISNSDTIQFMSESEAVSLVKEFPYCQSGQILLTLHLNQSNHLLFDQQLKKSAIYSSDRKKLFDLISSTKEKKVFTTKISLSEPILETSSEIVLSPKLITTEPIIELVSQANPIEKIVSTSETIVEEKNEREKLLELEYINQAISNSYTIELGEEISVRDENQETIEVLDTNAEFTFSDWLKHLPSGDKKINEKTTSIKSLKLDLIDKFIQEDPKIKPKKTEFYSPVNMARISVVDDSFLVSETLALIQVEQGNFEEALKTYHKLSLKNPEKRSYFANQIKILNQKIK